MGAVTGKGFSDLVRESFSLRHDGADPADAVRRQLRHHRLRVHRHRRGGRAVRRQPLHRRAARGRVGLAADHPRLLRLGGEDLPRPHAGLPRLHRRRLPGQAGLARGAAPRPSAPTLHFELGYLHLLIALIGTTISPYMQLYVQSSVVEKGVTPDGVPLHPLRRASSARSSPGIVAVVHHHRHRGDPLPARHRRSRPPPTRRGRWSRWPGRTPRRCSAWGCWAPRCWRPGCCRWPRPT